MILHVGPLGGEGRKLAVGMLTLHSVPGFVPSRYKGNSAVDPSCLPFLPQQLLPDHLRLKISVLLFPIPSACALG